MGKLVRDGIPALIRASGGRPDVRILDEAEYKAALLAKLDEECGEAVQATPDNLEEELADVLEVLQALAAAFGHAWEQVEQTAIAKRAAKGGFHDRLWLA